jgi:hypothetical protein
MEIKQGLCCWRVWCTYTLWQWGDHSWDVPAVINPLRWNCYPSTTSLPDAEDIEMGYDNYISAKIFIPVNGYQFANEVIKRRARDANGELIGRANPNPLLDTSVYKAELEDGSVERYHANILAEHLYSRLDNEGYTTSAFDLIINHKTSDESLRRRPMSKATTKSWTMCVQPNNRSTMWVLFSGLKDAQPIKTAEYARARGLEEEPAFCGGFQGL